MKITKLVAVVAALLGVAPIGVSAQTSGATNPARPVMTRSDVRELPADQQIIQALNRLTFGPRPGDALKVRAIGLDKWIDQQLHPERINDSAIVLILIDCRILCDESIDRGVSGNQSGSGRSVGPVHPAAA